MNSYDLVRRLILAFGGLLAIYLLVYHAREFSKFVAWSRAGFYESQLYRISDNPPAVVFQSVVPSDFVSGSIPTPGDTLVSVNDTAASQWSSRPYPSSQPVALQFLHQGAVMRTTLGMAPPPPLLRLGVGFCIILRLLIAGLSIAVAWMVLHGRVKDTVTYLLALYSLAVAAMVSLNYFLLPAAYAAFPLPFPVAVFWIWSLFANLYGGFWLHLQLLYPRPLEWVTRRPWLAVVLCYSPAVLLFIVWANLLARGAFIQALANPLAANRVFILIASVPILISVGILVYRYRRSRQLEARQLRLILSAVAIGALVQNATALAANLFPVWYNARLYRNLILISVTFVALLLGPMAFAYAFRKYGLMDVEARLRRATRFALTTGVVAAALMALTWLVNEAILERFHVTSRLPAMGLAFALALALPPVYRRANRFVEARFYPERDRLRGMLHGFLEQAASFPDAPSFQKELENRLRSVLNVHHVQLFWRSEKDKLFHPSSGLQKVLAASRRPLPVDEILGSGRVPVSVLDATWLRLRQVGLLLPLSLRDEYVGMLAIGLRIDGEDYDAEELRILNSLAPQIAVAIENLKLLEENLGKQRLEKELALARRTQEHLLPRVLPATPQLEIAAACRFCLEVAGDYYDIIALPDGKTVAAIGDVSGKGAGAALLMASLQASLHTAVNAATPLPELVAQINNLICRNTAPEQFITFFVAIFDPASSNMNYVNAGHNQPILARQDGSLLFLDEGGILLGCLPRATFRQGMVTLASGDTLLLYTDGANETRNERDEMLGDERLQRVLLDNRKRPPREIVTEIEQLAIQHHGRPNLEDDCTLLVLQKV